MLPWPRSGESRFLPAALREDPTAHPARSARSKPASTQAASLRRCQDQLHEESSCGPCHVPLDDPDCSANGVDDRQLGLARPFSAPASIPGQEFMAGSSLASRRPFFRRETNPALERADNRPHPTNQLPLAGSAVRDQGTIGAVEGMSETGHHLTQPSRTRSDGLPAVVRQGDLENVRLIKRGPSYLRMHARVSLTSPHHGAVARPARTTCSSAGNARSARAHAPCRRDPGRNQVP